MAHAYTPGLRVSTQATVRRRRQLPLKGEVLAAVGDVVRRDQVVGRTELPGNVTSLNLVNQLGVTPDELSTYMLKQEGDRVEAGEPIAETRPFVKWFKRTIQAPVSGTVESISGITGQVMLREPPRPVEVRAYVDGIVVAVLPGEGVEVETTGAFVQGIFGVGGERWGTLRVMADSADQVLLEEQIDDSCHGKILVTGSLVTLAVVRRAQEAEAVGVIGGGIRDRDLRDLLGYDLGVAITGAEEIGLSVIVTEGFGEIRMADKTFDILRSRSGREASVSGATQIRAGVMRPEIIISDPVAFQPRPAEVAAARGGLEVGSLVRAIRVPYFGRIGSVAALPSALQKVESGARVRVLEVVFEDGTRAIVPRANVEMIEV